MKSRFLSGLMLAVLVFPLSAQAALLMFSAPLSGLAEVPPNASPGSGTATVTVDDILKTMRVEAVFADLIGTTTVAHIHCCALPVATAGVATTVPTFPGFPVGVTSGSYDSLFDMTLASSFNPAFVTANGGTPDSAFTTLLAGLHAGTAYFNVHSSVFPAGELRGNLSPVDVPAPATLGLLGLALATWAVRGRRRTR